MSDPVGTARRPVTRWCDGKLQPETDLLAIETPVALEFNGISHAVMLATPTELEEFALGFALSEEIIAGRGEFRGAEVSTGTMGITVHCEIAPNAFFKLKQKRRSMTGRTGCGLCGTESLEQVIRTPKKLAGTATIRAASIDAALNALSTRQPLTRLTGGLHAAGWSDEQGRLQQVCEDVGRHNALDKLIGKMAVQGLDFQGGFLVISSRASVFFCCSFVSML